MTKFAIVATIKTTAGTREEYLKHLKAHATKAINELRREFEAYKAAHP